MFNIDNDFSCCNNAANHNAFINCIINNVNYSESLECLGRLSNKCLENYWMLFFSTAKYGKIRLLNAMIDRGAKWINKLEEDNDEVDYHKILICKNIKQFSNKKRNNLLKKLSYFINITNQQHYNYLQYLLTN
jgi:uncharacterized protein (DUF2344 family)